MRPKVEFNKIRDLGEVVDDSILFFKQNWKPLLKTYFTICGFFCVAGLIVSTFNQIQTFQNLQDGGSAYGLTYFLAMLFEVFNYVAITLTAYSFIAIYHQKGNEAPTTQEVWAYVKFYFFRMFGSSILLGIGFIIAVICCLFPGIYLWPIFSLVLAIMIIENTSLRYAFNRAFRLITNKWWYTFGVLIVTGIIECAAMILVLIPVEIITAVFVFSSGVKSYTAYTITSSVVTHTVQFLYLLPVIATAMVYFSLTEQKEDNTLLQRIEMLGKHDPENPTELFAEEY